MPEKGALVVQVVDAANAPVRDATVSLQRQGVPAPAPVTWNERLLGYQLDVEPAIYQVTVEAPGLLTETIEADARVFPRTERVMLGREGDSYYYREGRKVYFRQLTPRAGAFAPRETEKSPDLGPLVGWAGGRPLYLTRNLHVETAEPISIAALQALLADFPIKVELRDSVQPNLYLVRLVEEPSDRPELLLEQLRRVPGIRRVDSVLHADPTTTAVEPQDFLYPLQWNYSLMRVAEAWAELDANGTSASYGNPFVIVAIHDEGIKTSGGVVDHLQLKGTVTTPAGVPVQKVVFTYDLRSAPMVADNDAVDDPHGINVAGLISAAGEADGTIGIAANTRVAAYRWTKTADLRWAHAFLYAAGFVPGWKKGVGGYEATQIFPYLLGGGASLVLRAAIVNCSHTLPAMSPSLKKALGHISMFGRGRRGTLFFVSANNYDSKSRDGSEWGEDVNVMKVAASSLDHRGAEVRMPDSSWTTPDAPDIDFAAPSRSHFTLGPYRHSPPALRGIATLADAGSGDLPGTADTRAVVLDPLLGGEKELKISGADYAALIGLPRPALILDKDDEDNSEVRRAVSKSEDPAGTFKVMLDEPLTSAHASAELITGKAGYDATYGGTSAATPQAAAVAALMISAKPSLTWLEVRDILRRTAVPIDLKITGIDARNLWVHSDTQAVTRIADTNGLLILGGISSTKLSVKAQPKTRFIHLASAAVAAQLQPRQALLIGAETVLRTVGNLDALSLDVESTAGFSAGDKILVGRRRETVVVEKAPAGATSVVVANVDGFRVGDEITIGGQQVTITAVTAHETLSGIPPKRVVGADVKLKLSAGLAAPQAFGALVRHASPAQHEGPYEIGSAAGNTLTFVAGTKLKAQHPAGTIVQKENTEARAVIGTAGTKVEIDPLLHLHEMGEPVSVGLVATYSYGYGYGRIDALEAVKAAKSYQHDRDLMIRNFLEDDGSSNRGTKDVESPDIWIRNDAPTVLLTYDDPGNHQHPRVTVDPAIFVGAGKNDLEVSGVCTSAAEITFTIEIETKAPDTFKWSRDGVAGATGVAITGAAQPLSDGVSIRFAVSAGHTVGDRWLVKARALTERHFHLRVHNRGAKETFARSALAGALPVTQARVLLCASDGSPVCRFYGHGVNDLQVRGTYNGADRARYTVEILASGAHFRWFLNGTPKAPSVAITAGAPQLLDFGVSVVFASAGGHTEGDRWEIAARPMPAGFLNLDHYWDVDEVNPGAFDPATGEAGTRRLKEEEVPSLAPATDPDNSTKIFTATWPEALRPPTNSPNLPKPARSMRLFALGEVVPHDGALQGTTADTNNNISFRELVFAKFRFTRNGGADPAEGHLDVDEVGTAKTKSIRVEVRMTAGTFETERVRVKVTAKKRAGADEIRYFRYANGWGWDIATPWATVKPPVEARRPDGTEVPATGEQFDIHFDLDFTVDRTFTDLIFEPEILSAFREFPVASEAHTVAIYSVAPQPGGARQAAAAAQPKPASFVFADVASLTQSVSQGFGPVDGTPATKYRTTALFHAPNDTQAYAVTDGVVAVQRQAGSNVAVNLILRPLTQPVAGFPPVRYFIYRGLRLDEFLGGSSTNDEKRVRDEAGASAFIAALWTAFKDLNPSATTISSTFLGYDPAAADGDTLQNLFFRLDTEKQLPYVTKGTPLGLFHAAGGAFDFGFEIVLEDNAYFPDLGYARRAANVIDIGAMQTDDLARRLKKDEILAFLDPAAFYGLHLHEGGRVEVPGGPSLDGEEIFNTVVSHFATQHRLYLDVRSEHGRSLNFHRNYDDGSGHQIQTGTSAASVTAQAYATDGWPIVLLDSVAAADPNADHNELHVSLRRDDNVDPVLFVEHGPLLAAAAGGPFLRGDELGTAPWTAPVGLRFPNLSTTKVNVAWPLRLYYGRREVLPPATPPPPKPGVVPTATYTDNIFGPIDRTDGWATPVAVSDPVIKWATVQPSHYVDAEGTQGWRQMMRTGIAQQSGPTPRSLLYAMATAPDFEDPEFVPVRGVPDGVSSAASFFQERGLFGLYGLDQGVVVDANAPVRTLSLRQSAEEGYPPTGAMLVGVTDAELTTLRGLGATTMTTDYDRTLILDGKTTVTNGGASADRYRLGVRGLATDGTPASEFPSADIHVYSVDGRVFASPGFAAAEPPPGPYGRNWEEARGADPWPVRQRRIDAVDVATSSITIAADDWRSELVAGNSLEISGSENNDGPYTAASVTFNGTDTVIVLSGSPVLLTDAPWGSVFTIARTVEDFFIDRDYRPANPNGIPSLRALVDGFVGAINLVAASDANAKSSLQALVDTAASKILKRARWLANDDRAAADEAARSLYYARLRMAVALKSHEFCRSLSEEPAQDPTPLLVSLEERSRGYDLDFANAPADSLRVLVTGFDPYVPEGLEYRLNPSGAVALALHGTTIAGSGKTAYVESAVFPVRYADFDAGAVEKLAGKWLMGQTPDPTCAAMIVTVSLDSQIPVEGYDVERLAGRQRGWSTRDNANERRLIPQQIGDSDLTWAPFYESTLPVEKMVLGPFLSPPDHSQKVFFDQSYRTLTTASQFHPREGDVNDNKKNPAATPTAEAVKGSGGDFLSNEVFYRVARERETRHSLTLTGHIHIPFASKVTNGITAVVDQVEELIRRALAGL